TAIGCVEERDAGDGEEETAALLQAALNPDGAALRFDSQLTEGQPQAGAAHLPAAAVYSCEAIKDALPVLFGNARSCVADLATDARLVPWQRGAWPHVYPDATTGRRELERVVQQIEHDAAG